jgi:hypothetical protein
VKLGNKIQSNIQGIANRRETFFGGAKKESTKCPDLKELRMHNILRTMESGNLGVRWKEQKDRVKNGADNHICDETGYPKNL